MQSYRFVSPAERDFLVKILKNKNLSKKDINIALLTFLASLGFCDKINVLENFDIVVKCDFLIAERIKLNFGSSVEILDIFQDDDSVKH